MKKNLLFITLLLISFAVNSTAQRMIQPGKNWNVLDIIWTSGNTNNYGIESDTIIGGVTYQKVFRNGALQVEGDFGPSYIRETDDGKVYSNDYLQMQNPVDEILLYDFSLMLADTFIMGYPHSPGIGGVLVVSMVDTVILSDGIPRKRLFFEDIDFMQSDFTVVWIQGIGDADLGPFHAHLFYWFDLGSKVLCTYEEEELIYQNPGADSCFITITSVQELDPTIPIKIYPNPVLDLLTLDFSEIDFSFTEISIYSTTGAKVFYAENTSHLKEIDMSDLTNGIYFLVLKDKTGASYSQRVLKQ